TAQQPLNNISRVTIQALAAVCGGTQSLHTNSYDEAIGLPTEDSATVALRTQQIISEESGVANVVDPLGGSWLVESLTKTIKQEARTEIEKIDQLNGALKAIEGGYQQRAIHDSAWSYLQEIESGERKVVGVNYGVSDSKVTPASQPIDPAVQEEQIKRLDSLREQRDNTGVTTALAAVSRAAEQGSNLFPPVLDAVNAECSLGEIVGAMQDVFGTYRAPSGF
ncbi:MAG: methylmalonyl-CoA mutase family protein, partial [Candidatus Poseidoniaceae archaeon]|nr:methylmalonyl-CoA mutase family protein [Candidatus Poseidoniaceae archaeon]